MGLLTFGINITLDGCIDHREGLADDELHRYWTALMDGGAAMLWGRVTYEMMVAYWPTEQAAKNDAKIAVALGKGRTLFEGMGGTVGLTLTETRSFDNGNVVLTYSAN